MGRYSSKNTTSDYLQLDIRQLRRKGFLRPGYSSTLTWSSRGEVVGSMQLRVELDRVVLNYRHKRCGEDWKSYEYPVFLDTTPCNYGGFRDWFLCPASGCGRRVAILYGGDTFACRQCYQLAYESQREASHSRALGRAQAIRHRLGGSPDMSQGFPWKPKGMHWETYSRLRGEYERAANASWPPWVLRMMAK